MTYGDFRSAKDAINRFVYDDLIENTLCGSAPETFNLQNRFSDFLVSGSFNKLRADEEAEKQASLIQGRLNEALDSWRALGLPSPLGYADSDDVLLTWRHSSYADITGYTPLSSAFVDVYDWLTNLNARDFLLPCAAFFKLIGCDPIFITDGSRDEGIDCIGRIADGPSRSILVFAQCKTKEKDRKVFGKETLFQEYGKYASLPKTDKYREYLRALKFEEIRDGTGSLYFMMSNGEFASEAQTVARNIGMILRSARQLAYFLSTHSGITQLTDLLAAGIVPSNPRLEYKYSSRASFVTTRANGTKLTLLLHKISA